MESRLQTRLTRTTILFSLAIVGIDSDLIRERWVDVHLAFLSQRVPSNGLEGLFHVDVFLGTRLEVWNISFALTPCLRSGGGNLNESRDY